MESNIKEGVYFVKDGKPVEYYMEGVDTDRLLVVGRYCQFYLSLKDYGRKTWDEAMATEFEDGYGLPDRFQGLVLAINFRTIIEAARKLDAEFIAIAWWFWTKDDIDDLDIAWYISTQVCDINANDKTATYSVFAVSAL